MAKEPQTSDPAVSLIAVGLEVVASLRRISETLRNIATTLEDLRRDRKQGGL